MSVIAFEVLHKGIITLETPINGVYTVKEETQNIICFKKFDNLIEAMDEYNRSINEAIDSQKTTTNNSTFEINQAIDIILKEQISFI